MNEAAPKKGNKSWEPARALNLVKKDAGFRYRWASADPANLEKKQAEGWEFASGPEVHDRPKGVEHGKQIGSLKQYRDVVLMRIPEDMARARDEYMRTQTDAQTKGITKRLKNNVARQGDATVTGSVQINDQTID